MNCFIPPKESQCEDFLWPESLGASMERWKKERDRVAAVVEEFRTHCQTNKATKWEETLLNALRQSSQTMSAIAVQLEQHKEKLNRHATPTVVTPPGASPATPIATSLGSVVLAEFYSDHRIELSSKDFR